MKPSTLGQRIEYYRKKAGLKQKELAAIVGMSFNAISLYEGDKRKPNIAILSDIANALHVTSDTLLGLDKIKSNGEHTLLRIYKNLNDLGQERAIEIISGLEELPKYSKFGGRD